MDEKRKKRQIAKISVFITSIFVIFLSVTYAFINMTVTGTKRQVITSGNLQVELEEDNAITLTNAMPMYDEVGMIQDSFNFRLVNKTSEDTNYIVRLVDITDASIKKLDTSIVKYGLTKDGVSTIDLLSILKDNQIDSGTISGNQTIHYSLRLWINSTVTDNASIEDKTLSYRINVEVSQQTQNTLETVSDFAFAEANLGTSCKTYDDGTDTFLVGQCKQNYIWYSGKLWRIVLKNNETGNIKMVTDNNMTTIAYNESDNTAFENSYMDQWLSQEFLPTLHDTNQFLVTDSMWNVTTDSSTTPARPNGTTTVNRTVGLLNSYEYYTTYNNSDGLATYSTGYLNNGTYWWLATPFSASDVWDANDFGRLLNGTPTYVFGARPSVNLKSNIQITSGDGTESNPYRLEGDSKETINGTTLLNTRYSGEYVRFNSELYRIVVVENNVTKITAVDKPSTLSSNRFHTASGVTNFGEASIKTDLETYYQGLDETTKNMIERDTTWYLGTVGSGTNYKASTCSTVDSNTDTKMCEKTTSTTIANIGLPRYGEIFTSQITRGTKDYFWTLTPYSASDVWYADGNGGLDGSNPTNVSGARPSMYLKSYIRIASSNTGDGTYEKPYDIELVV